MSMDLFAEGSRDYLMNVPVVKGPEPGIFDGFVRGTGMAAAKGISGAISGLDVIAGGAMYGGIDAIAGTTLQPKFFQSMDDYRTTASEYWTAKPNEVGVAGQVMGGLVGQLSLLLGGPATMVAGVTAGQMVDLAEKGVPVTQAVAAGTVTGAGTAAGVWLPILGNNAWQRILVGGAAFNAAQGQITRTANAAILAGTPAEKEYQNFDGLGFTIDTVLGMAFGGYAHFSPAQRAQGAAMWEKIDAWAKNLTPSDKAALATLKLGEHLNDDSTPGKPATALDVDYHTTRARTAVDQLITTGHVDVENLPKPNYTPDPVKEAQSAEVQRALMEAGPEVAKAEGISEPVPLFEQSKERIANDIMDQLRATGRFPDDVNQANATLLASFYGAQAKRLGITPEEMYQRYPVAISNKVEAQGEALPQSLQQAARKTTETPEFKTWFDKSAVVDDGGQPKVVYHGTNQSFDSFSRSRIGKNTTAASSKEFFFTEHPAEATEYANLAARTQPSDSVNVEKKSKQLQAKIAKAEKAQDWNTAERLYQEMEDLELGAIREGEVGQNIMPVFLNVKNPLVVDMNGSFDGHRVAAEFKRAKAAGHDGLKLLNVYDPVSDRPGAFTTTQWVAFKPEQIKSAIGNNGKFDSKNPSILKQTAPKGPIFHSELARQLETAPIKAAPAKEWLNYIKGLANKGVKAEEVKWSGLEDWLAMQPGKVTKEQVNAFLREGGVKVEEVELGGNPEAVAKGRAMAEAQGHNWDDLSPTDQRRYRNAANDVAISKDMPGETKFSSYQLPGGQNYKELLLTLPGRGDGRTFEQWASDTGRDLNDYPASDIPILKKQFEAESQRDSRDNFTSSHFDQKNILAHVRFNERTDADGKKVLFIEEVQSDWGQAGKKQGFKEKMTEVQTKRLEELDRIPDDKLTAAEKAEYEKLVTMRDSSVPAGPFVGKTEAWVALAMKRMIRYASENGFDRVAWTTGEQQAARYDLSKQVSEVQYDPERKLLKVRDLNDNKIMEKVVEPGNIEDHVGKDVAKKLLETPLNGPYHTVSGDGLKVGGEGMKTFYDKIIPNVANDVLKKLGGGRVEPVDMPLVAGSKIAPEMTYTGPEYTSAELVHSSMRKRIDNATQEAQLRDVANEIRGGATFAEAMATHGSPGLAAKLGGELTESAPENAKQMGFEVTPAMKEKAMAGQSLFQKTEGQAKGQIDFGGDNDTRFPSIISLFKTADRSTFMHETGHLQLEVLQAMARMPDAPPEIIRDLNTLVDWFGVDKAKWDAMTFEEKVPYHEQFARGFESYLMEGKAPTPELKGIFQRFRDWLLDIYKSFESLDVKLTDDVRGVMDRLLASQEQDPSTGASPRNPASFPPPPGGEVKAGAPTPKAGEAAKPDPLRTAADQYVAANPDRLIRVGTTADGDPIHKTAGEWLAQERMAAELVRKDAGLFEVAAGCMLGSA